jgi:hypothetical protein
MVDGEAEFHSASTNASGAYSISGLAPGTYYAWTSSALNFVNEIYDNIPCFGACFYRNAIEHGTPIVVGAGATVPNRNFALSPGGRIRGTVTDQATGVPLSGVQVYIVNAVTHGTVEGVTTNAQGQYTTAANLATGNYYAYTFNSAGYYDEVYDNIDCAPGCLNIIFAAGATPIGVTAPAQTTGVDFALVRGATIAGIVRDAGTNAPLDGVQIVLATTDGSNIGGANTIASGTYLIEGVRPGTYYVFTHNGLGYINEVYDNIHCIGQCVTRAGELAIQGTPIVVTAAGAAITGKDFALARGGRISGTVLAADTSAPLPGTIAIYTTTAALATEAEVDSSGAYLTYAGLPTGTYYAAIQTFEESYVNEIYDNVVCPGFCEPTDTVAHGTPIAVTIGATTSQRNFQLGRGGRITGRVTNAAGTGVADVSVRANPIAGNNSYSGRTNAAGDYEIQGLPPGAYVLFTENGPVQGLVDEIYDNIACIVRCDDDPARLKGARVTVAIAATTSGVNFALAQAGTLSGKVTNAATGAPLENVALFVLSAAFGPGAPASPEFAAEYTDAAGAFRLSGLPSGAYYVYTENEDGFLDEAFANLLCLGGCPGAAVLGAQVSVTAGQPTTGVDFALDPGGRISGVVRDAVTLLPTSADIDIVDAAGRLVQRAFGGGEGTYITRSGLAAGTYYAAAKVEDVYLSEVFGGAPCRGACAPESIVAVGAPIVVAAGATTSGRDFALERGAQIFGKVREAGTGVPIVDEDRTVEFYDSAGRYAATAYFRSDGDDYTSTPPVPGGSYFAFTTSFTHRNEIYDNLPCPAACEPSRAPGGSPIAAAAGANTPGINFDLAPRAGVPGAPTGVVFSPHPQGVLIAWRPPENGGVASTYLLEAGLAPGSTAVSFAVVVPQFLAVGAPPGRYFVRIRALNASGTGPASAEATLVIGGGGPLPDAPRAAQAWMIGSRLMMTWDEPEAGGAPTNYLVEAGTAPGLANLATIVSTRRAFTYTPVPAGFYFLRVRAVNATGASAPSNDVMIVAGGASSPPRAPHQVGARAAGSTVTFTWSAPAGSVTGYVLEAGSAPGLSNLAVADIGLVTTISFAQVPAGRYYVRIRAVNALGRSVASDEVVVSVG